MIDKEAAMKSYHIFLFSLRVISDGLGLAPSKQDYLKIWAVVKRIADGDQQFNASLAEIMLKDPDMTKTMQEHHERTITDQSGREHEIAKLLIAASEGFAD